MEVNYSVNGGTFALPIDLIPYAVQRFNPKIKYHALKSKIGGGTFCEQLNFLTENPSYLD